MQRLASVPKSLLRRTTGVAPYVARRHAHVGFQGSGVTAEAASSVRTVGEAYTGGSNTIIGGPGSSDHSWFEFGGAQQTDEGQQGRLDDGMLALIQAHQAGDHEVHLSGHSRGAGNALLMAQLLQSRGLVHPHTGEQVRPPGVPVHSLNLFDAVPFMPGEGQGNAVVADGQVAPVPYEDLTAPANVGFMQHFLAGGEQRNLFRQANIPPSSPTTESVHPVVPNARHNEVGGRRGGNPDAIALTESVALQNLAGRGLPFDAGGALPAVEHNERLRRLRVTPPQPGTAEQLMAALGGQGPRQFPPYASELGEVNRQ